MTERDPNLYELPDHLPIPEDDGAADHLSNAAVPLLVLQATNGEPVDLAAAAGKGALVVYVYPQTGVPGQPTPTGTFWSLIKMADGSWVIRSDRPIRADSCEC